MANNFKVFAENGTNILGKDEYISDTERNNGFQPNTIIKSAITNTVLRQCSLIVAALVETISMDTLYPEIDGTSSYDETLTALQDCFTEYIGNQTIDTCDYANNAYNIYNFRNTSSGLTISFTWGENNEYSFSHTVDAGTAANAENVTTYINNILISNILEGSKAKVAIKAENISGGVQGSIPYQSSTNTTGFIAPANDSSGAERVLTTAYENGTNVYRWELKQTITIEDNNDGTVNLYISNTEA